MAPGVLLHRIRVSEGQRVRHGSLIHEPRAPGEVVPGVQHKVCQFPLWRNGDPAPREPLFCRAPVVIERSWCAAHCAIVFVKAAQAAE